MNYDLLATPHLERLAQLEYGNVLHAQQAAAQSTDPMQHAWLNIANRHQYNLDAIIQVLAERFNKPPVILCPHCQQAMESALQHWSHKPPTVIVTCRTADCVVQNVTATVGSMDETFAPFLALAEAQRLDDVLEDARFSPLWAYGLRPNVPLGSQS